MARLRHARGVLVAIAVMASSPSLAPAQAAAGGIGVQDQSYAPLARSPTGTKPESKLWFADGRWWAVLFAPRANAHRIFSLDRATGGWVDSGTTVDTRPDTRADVLWDAAARKLYVASHVFDPAGIETTPANVGRLWRFSYSAITKSYSLDLGFPVDVNAAATETLVIDKDSTGRLWATWIQESRVFVNHTTTRDTAWGMPYVVPGPRGATTLLRPPDDISSVVHFGADRIGVMWSNQADGNFWFAVHADGTDDTAASWSVAAVPAGASTDDHMNLKADAAGRVFAAVKTSEIAAARPLILLLVRAPNGAWTSHTVGRVSDSHTRPIVLLDEQHARIHVLATCPHPPIASGQGGGDICEKTSPAGVISFASGPGRPVIRAGGRPGMNDVTSTKQSVDAASGLVALANHAATSRYWHADVALGAPARPAASFTATPSSGPAPLTVHFTDTSTNAPAAWRWTFGDGSRAATEQSPTHVYAAPGTYTVALRATNAAGSNTATSAGAITVSAAAPPAPAPPATGPRATRPGGGGAGRAVSRGVRIRGAAA
jgi:PKD domain